MLRKELYPKTILIAGTWVGVHLDTPQGKNDGAVQGMVFLLKPAGGKKRAFQIFCGGVWTTLYTHLPDATGCMLVFIFKTILFHYFVVKF